MLGEATIWPSGTLKISKADVVLSGPSALLRRGQAPRATGQDP
jgi:hypothetical protein